MTCIWVQIFFSTVLISISTVKFLLLSPAINESKHPIFHFVSIRRPGGINWKRCYHLLLKRRPEDREITVQLQKMQISNEYYRKGFVHPFSFFLYSAFRVYGALTSTTGFWMARMKKGKTFPAVSYDGKVSNTLSRIFLYQHLARYNDNSREEIVSEYIAEQAKREVTCLSDSLLAVPTELFVRTM